MLQTVCFDDGGMYLYLANGTSGEHIAGNDQQVGIIFGQGQQCAICMNTKF